MLTVVLVEPEIPQNAGNIARTCAVTGCSLRMVHPLGFRIDDAKLKRAGLDYWHSLDITYYDSFEQAIEGAERIWLLTTKAEKSCYDASFGENDFLVFGPETRGLSAGILSTHPEGSMRIPMQDNQRSLNLSNAVAITVYEALRQLSFPGMR